MDGRIIWKICNHGKAGMESCKTFEKVVASLREGLKERFERVEIQDHVEPSRDSSARKGPKYFIRNSEDDVLKKSSLHYKGNFFNPDS